MKRVLLLAPSTFGYEKRILGAIQAMGYYCELIDERVGNTFLAKAATRLGFLRLMPWLVNTHVDRIIDRLREISADQLLLINPETLRGAELARIRSEFPDLEIVVYRWDSLYQKPIDETVFEVADAVYSFDPDDCARDARLRHLPLFHSFEALPESPDPEGAIYDFSFVGTTQFRRVRILGHLCQVLDAHSSPYFFYLKAQSRLHAAFFRIAALYFGYRGKLSVAPLSYAEFLNINRKSTGIVDINFPRQSGLTMRTFEIIFSGKPMLTTNANALLYDFADSAAITIFDENTSSIPCFEKDQIPQIAPYFQRYSIMAWARTLIEQEAHAYFAPGKESAS